MPFEQVRPADKVVTLITTANTTGTLTIPAVANYRHYITNIDITRINGGATDTAPTGVVNITSTNLNGLSFSLANSLKAGETIEVVRDYSTPLVSTTKATATTIVLPAGGAGISYRVNVSYYLGE